MKDILCQEMDKKSVLIEKVFKYDEVRNQFDIVNETKYKPRKNDKFVLQIVNQKLFC